MVTFVIKYSVIMSFISLLARRRSLGLRVGAVVIFRALIRARSANAFAEAPLSTRPVTTIGSKCAGDKMVSTNRDLLSTNLSLKGSLLRRQLRIQAREFPFCSLCLRSRL